MSRGGGRTLVGVVGLSMVGLLLLGAACSRAASDSGARSTPTSEAVAPATVAAPSAVSTPALTAVSTPATSGEPSHARTPASSASAESGEVEPPPVRGPNTRITSFGKAKRALREIYIDRRVTLYCGCAYDEDHQVDHESCGYVAANDNARARRVEWEHIVPAEAFGHGFVAWRDGHPDCVDRRGKRFRGRDCARKVAVPFRFMEADMYNLVPAIGEVNGLRSNYSMGMIEGEARAFGACDVEIADRKIEPRPEVRGDVARTYLYMEQAYPGRGVISDKNRRLFEAWAEEDPVDRWECERARRIAEVQRNLNAVVDAACREAGL